MPTTVQNTIGSGRDYSSIQAWEDASPANLVTSDQVWEGLLYPEGAGTNGEWTVSTTIAVGGTTTDSTRYKRLTTASGQSWRNNGTPVLRYDTAKGVAIRATGGYANGNPFSISEGRFQLVGLQIKANGSQPVVRAYANGLIDACVLMTSAYTSGYCVSDSAQSGVTVQNSVLLSNAAWSVGGGASSMSVLNCVMCADASGTATNSSYSSTAICKNSGFFGFSSIGAGFAAGSSYNATDLGSLSGSNNLTSLTASSQFVNATIGTSLDLTIKAGAGLIDAGTASGVPAVDALGVARGATYDIGATEYTSAASSFKASSKIITQAIGGMY